MGRIPTAARPSLRDEVQRAQSRSGNLVVKGSQAATRRTLQAASPAHSTLHDIIATNARRYSLPTGFRNSVNARDNPIVYAPPETVRRCIAMPPSMTDHPPSTMLHLLVGDERRRRAYIKLVRVATSVAYARPS